MQNVVFHNSYLIYKTKHFFFKMMWPNDTINKIEPQHDKTNKMSVRPAKTQIRLDICPVWSES